MQRLDRQLVWLVSAGDKNNPQVATDAAAVAESAGTERMFRGQ